MLYEESQRCDEYIYMLSHNQTLHNLLDMIKGIISRDKKFSAASAERRAAITAEHLEIIRAMEARDKQKAQEAISEHIRNGRKFIEPKR